MTARYGLASRPVSTMATTTTTSRITESAAPKGQLKARPNWL